MSEVDSTKNVYLFTHGRMDLNEKAINALESKGFSKDSVVLADPKVAGDVGDYMAMLWMPPNPDHIKIQKITNSMVFLICHLECKGKIIATASGIWKILKKPLPNAGFGG